MAREEKKVKCPKCGFLNAYGTIRCSKCRTDLKIYKSCPRCAKVNSVEVDRCVSCGYNFNRKEKGLLFNFILSVLLVVALFVVNYLDPSAFAGFTKNMKRVAVFVIIIILIATLTYGKKDIKKYSAEEQIIENQKLIQFRKYTSIILGILLAALFVFISFKYLIK